MAEDLHGPEGQEPAALTDNDRVRRSYELEAELREIEKVIEERDAALKEAKKKHNTRVLMLRELWAKKPIQLSLHLDVTDPPDPSDNPPPPEGPTDQPPTDSI